MLAGAAAPIGAAWLTRAALDNLAAGGTSTLVWIVVFLAALGMVVAFVPQAEEYLRTEVARRSGLRATDRLYQAVSAFTGLRRFEDPHFIDRVRLADQGTAAPAQIVGRVVTGGRAALTLTGFMISLAVLSPPMVAVVLAAAVPTLVAELFLSRRRASMLWKIGPAERRAFFYSHLLTNSQAAKESRLYGTGAFLRGRMLAERRTADAAHRRTDRRELFTQGGLALMGALVAGGGLVAVVLGSKGGTLTPGDLSLFIVAVAGVQNALTTLITDIAYAHQQLLAFDHHCAVMRAGPDAPVAEASHPAPPLRKGIEFRDVWFRYRDDHPWVVRGVDLHIPHGTSMALVGRNGAGKSTLVKLLCRFYEPTRGTIYWDGVDIRTIDPERLRDRIAAVFQDFMQYDLTAAENIALGDLTALDDPFRIEDAAMNAGIHRTLTRLPRGYDTLLSTLFVDEAGEESDPEMGVVLSGGQWQRLALARALIRTGRDLVILDEPCAGLDAEAEYEVHAQLRRRRAGGTSLLISHRLGTVRDADEIVVLERGEVVERGDHRDLMALNGTYAGLFRLQAENYHLDDVRPGAGIQ
ncbi:ABC transporter ATP-binding protein [Actinomadura rudentiformis]|uniref:ABC transporter ATP-binding protein n=2 Tax=Actinomadura rudentiformis TaxID=359158 RepID=A0A6H9YHB4_9ACTN|nr:ABC transporter ATP-binding protein [Actinomadura rudentiformis]